MVFGGTIFALTTSFAVLLIAAVIGVISPSGYEVGPFLSIEQSALSNITPDEKRTHIFAWYNLAGLFTTALGAIVTGILVQLLQNAHITPVASYRTVIVGYAALGLLLAALFARSPLLWRSPGKARAKFPPSSGSALAFTGPRASCSNFRHCFHSMRLRVASFYKAFWPIGSTSVSGFSLRYWAASFSGQTFSREYRPCRPPGWRPG